MTKRLLERYHLGKCTPEEQAQVEEWLQDDTFAVPDLPPEIDKEAEVAEIWNTLEEELFADGASENTITQKSKRWIHTDQARLAIACSLLFILSIIVYWSLGNQTAKGSFMLSNFSSNLPKAIDTRDYFVSISPKTSVEINLDTGFAHISGSLVLQPKDDMQLAFNGHPEKIHLVNGNSYIVISNEDDKPFIMNKKDLLHLPPIIRQQIFSQLSI